MHTNEPIEKEPPLSPPSKKSNITTADRALGSGHDQVCAGTADIRVVAGLEDGVRGVVKAHIAHIVAALSHRGPGSLNWHAINCD